MNSTKTKSKEEWEVMNLEDKSGKVDFWMKFKSKEKNQSFM